MKFTFIIASLGERNEQLQTCISSIEEACKYKENHDIKILVVFQNIDCKENKIKTKCADLVEFHYIEKKGLAFARNYAIRTSNSDIFIFLDDDAQIKSDFLSVLFQAIKDSSTGAFCGKLIDPKANQCYTINFLNEYEKFLTRIEFTYFMGSAHILKKDAIRKIGFYDEAFGTGGKFCGAEESDIFFRLLKNNIKIKYVPNLIFYHPISCHTDYSKVFNYSFAVGAMLTKQMISDQKHLLTYLLITSKLFLKSFLRDIQKLFSKSIANKDKRFHYRASYAGLFKGIFCYLREGKYAHRN